MAAESCAKKIAEEDKYDWNETIESHVKVAVIGDSGCGKSALILAACGGTFPHPAETFVSKHYPMDVEVGGKVQACMVAELDDGDDQLERRKGVYSETDVVLVCFTDPEKAKDVGRKWISEVKTHVPKVPVILVWLKRKLDDDVVASEHIEMEGLDGMQCCPHEHAGVLEVFKEAVKKALEHGICEKK